MKKKEKKKEKKKLNKNVKFVLNMLSHYKFRKHLINKANEYGCEVNVITEEDTSITCTKCGHMSKKYEKRQKICEECGYKIDRDINGSRNILIKNIKSFIKEEKKIIKKKGIKIMSGKGKGRIRKVKKNK